MFNFLSEYEKYKWTSILPRYQKYQKDIGPTIQIDHMDTQSYNQGQYQFQFGEIHIYLFNKTRMSESLIFLQIWSDFDGVFARGCMGLGPRVTGKILATENT